MTNSNGKEIYLQVQKFKAKIINCKELDENLNKFIIFDARTKKEFDLFHIPNSIHIPLVSNQEHHEVGYLYKQVSPKVAYELGFDYIYKNVSDILKHANKFKNMLNKTIVIYCARGGIRSKTLTYLLSTQGFDVIQLKDGMKGYRNFILEQLETIKIPQLIILQGLAGARKTIFLENLKNSIDLEKCAKHNSSLYGALDHIPNSQKQFIFELYAELKFVNQNKFNCVFIEGEARKIGNVIIPARIWDKMNNTKTIFLKVNLNIRAKHFADTYPNMIKYQKQYLTQTKRLDSNVSKKLKEELLSYIQNNEPFKFWKLILKDYYDPKYEHSFKNLKFEKIIDANDFDKTLKLLKEY